MSMNLGEKIAWLRKKNNMTQAELGDAVNVTYQAVSKWERGESLPDFDTISKISKLFQVPISYFDEGGEDQVDGPPAPTQQTAEMIGMCVQCGKVVHEGEAAETAPKLICNACAELNRNAEKQRKIDAENKKAAEKEKAEAAVKYEKTPQLRIAYFYHSRRHSIRSFSGAVASALQLGSIRIYFSCRDNTYGHRVHLYGSNDLGRHGARSLHGRRSCHELAGHYIFALARRTAVFNSNENLFKPRRRARVCRFYNRMRNLGALHCAVRVRPVALAV